MIIHTSYENSSIHMSITTVHFLLSIISILAIGYIYIRFGISVFIYFLIFLELYYVLLIHSSYLDKGTEMRLL